LDDLGANATARMIRRRSKRIVRGERRRIAVSIS
jgi:hypothetical protein